MRVMVIGARGFIGAALTAHLQACGDTVHAVSSREPGGIDPDSGRLSSGFNVPPGVDAVVYLAQSPHARGGPAWAAHMLNVNVVSAVAVASAARDAGVRRFLYTSSGSVYQPSFSPLRETGALRRDDPYAASKVHAEEMLRPFEPDLSVVVARLFTVYGPGQRGRLIPRIVEAVAAGRPVRLDPGPDGADDGLRISICDVGDAVALIRYALSGNAPDVFNLASPHPVSLRWVAETAAAVLGCRTQFEEGSMPRQGNLIADVSRLLAMAPGHVFASPSDGIARVAAHVNDPGGAGAGRCGR
jgi:nucleoside-diphosphate-sugar epimerase